MVVTENNINKWLSVAGLSDWDKEGLNLHNYKPALTASTNNRFWKIAPNLYRHALYLLPTSIKYWYN